MCLSLSFSERFFFQMALSSHIYIRFFYTCACVGHTRSCGACLCIYTLSLYWTLSAIALSSSMRRPVFLEKMMTACHPWPTFTSPELDLHVLVISSYPLFPFAHASIALHHLVVEILAVAGLAWTVHACNDWKFQKCAHARSIAS